MSMGERWTALAKRAVLQPGKGNRDVVHKRIHCRRETFNNPFGANMSSQQCAGCRTPHSVHLQHTLPPGQSEGRLVAPLLERSLRAAAAATHI